MISLSDELAQLAAGVARMASDLNYGQAKLLAYGRKLEAIVSAQAAELEREKAGRDVSIAERTADLSASNAQLRQQVSELSDRNR